MNQFYPYQELSKEQFLQQALHWASSQSHFSLHLNNQISYPHNGFDELLAVGAKQVMCENAGSVFQSLKNLHQNEWLFGYLGYDLKNELEKLESRNAVLVGFPDASFFQPEHIIHFEKNGVTVESDQSDLVEEILQHKPKPVSSLFGPSTASVSKEEYINHVEALRQHIEDGDCYEINFCQEFHGQVASWNAVESFLELNRISPKPFACFQKHNQYFILSASPERFVKKAGNQIISQPIKGTRPRGKSPSEDEALKTELRNSEKEMAENMMIVDLVRNDLSRTAKTGTVKVEEMFGIYSFQQVHQMISTVVSELKKDTHFIDVIEKAFPMGSMTGAPKVKVMQLIEHYENTKRGAFSGAAGYIKPSGDFDFNVLIRSLFVNDATKTYSFQVGSAITYDAVAEQEYDECLVKAKALFQLLNK